MRGIIVLRNCLILNRDPLPLAGTRARVQDTNDPDHASEVEASWATKPTPEDEVSDSNQSARKMPAATPFSTPTSGCLTRC